MLKAYVLPFALYLLGTALIAEFDEGWYPWAYAAVVVLVTAVLVWSLREKGSLRGTGILRVHRRVVPGVVAGVVGIAIWIGLSHLRVEQTVSQWLPTWLQSGERVGFDPFTEMSGVLVWLFIAVRLIGLAVVVPLAEELFWRGFLLRWLVDPDWEKVPIGRYTFSSCMLVTGMFALAHPEWLAAAVWCLLINGLLYWTKDLWQCVVAHATSNLLLGLYVLTFGQWWLW